MTSFGEGYFPYQHNNTGRIPSLAGLSRFDHQVWRLAGIRVACGSSQALEQVFFHYSTFIVPPHLLGQDLLGSYGFGLTPHTGCAFCVRPPVPNW